MTTAQDGGKVVSLTHRPPLPPVNTPGTHFCYRLSQPQSHSAIGRILCQWKIPMTPAGIKPATFRFVVQHLDHCATAVPAYYVAKAIGLQKSEQGQRPEFWLNNCTSNTTMLQPQRLSNSLWYKHHCWAGTHPLCTRLGSQLLYAHSKIEVHLEAVSSGQWRCLEKCDGSVEQ